MYSDTKLAAWISSKEEEWKFKKMLTSVNTHHR